ncbi:MAG: ROK family protein [Acidobacteria bacterium]|nr:ROK family protein [Acidobacteriota bacterium]
MSPAIGVLAAEHIAAGLVENNRLVNAIRVFPNSDTHDNPLIEMPVDDIVQRIAEQIISARQEREISAVGLGFPGIIRDGVIEDSPNLQQMKGNNLADSISSALKEINLNVTVQILNDADAMAAGIAAMRGQLDRLIRVWFLGSGVGYGRYPQAPGVWEGGHMVVSLEPKEQFCRCGGQGHLEGIMGDRAMRLRFLDLEPEEVFAEAKEGDKRCREFVKMWHRALAAATATSIHLDGPGKFFISGPHAQFVQVNLLDLYVHDMVKMSPLQGSTFEIVPTTDELAIIGAAVSAQQLTGSNS